MTPGSCPTPHLSPRPSYILSTRIESGAPVIKWTRKGKSLFLIHFDSFLLCRGWRTHIKKGDFPLRVHFKLQEHHKKSRRLDLGQGVPLALAHKFIAIANLPPVVGWTFIN